MEFGQLHHVEYYVNDLGETTKFWGWFLQQLGYTEHQRWRTGISWAHKSGTYIVFVQVEEQFKNSGHHRHGVGLNHICFQGKSKEHLQFLAGEIQNRQARLLVLSDDRICFEDSNRFAVEVFL